MLRAAASASLGMVPYNEQPTPDDLEGYMQRFPPKQDLAWGDQYPQLCAWLADREARKAKDANEEASHDSQGSFNFRRQ